MTLLGLVSEFGPSWREVLCHSHSTPCECEMHVCMLVNYVFYVSTVMPDLAEVLRHFDSKVCNPSEGTKIGYHGSVHSPVT